MLAGNLVDTPPRGTFDVAVLRYFIQTLSTEQAQQAIRHVGHVLEPNSTLYIIGYILNKDRISPPEATTFNLVFINIYAAGQAYTVQ